MEKLTPENFDDFINNIFDKIFKLFFTHKSVAVDCLTHFVDKKIVDKLDLEHTDEKDGILIEVFKFLKNENYLTHFFQPLLAFIMKTGNFEQPQVKQMMDNYLTPQQKQEPMTVRISTADRWEARGEAHGEARGKAIGEVRGEQKKAHVVILRGLFMGYKIESLQALAQVPEEEALVLSKGYDAVKKAWKKKKVDIPTLSQTTSLSEEEVQYIISCLDSTMTDK